MERFLKGIPMWRVDTSRRVPGAASAALDGAREHYKKNRIG
jgi:hypothetical protein